MLQIHPNARTTPVTRAEIAGSHERTGVLAQRYGVSTETIRKWRKRGVADCLDHSARPHQLPWKATEEERAIVCTLRRLDGASEVLVLGLMGWACLERFRCLGRSRTYFDRGGAQWPTRLQD